jgi:electron transfer flavoprotein alpha subunit
MADIFAYITHKDGVADDSALELVAAAKKIDAGAAVTAIVAGSGADLDTVADDVAASYAKVLKFNNWTPWPTPMPKSSANCWSTCCRPMPSS